MKRLCLCAVMMIFATVPLFAQQKAPASPSTEATGNIGGKTLSIRYSSPGVKGRAGHIFSKDGLISHDPHYPVWRAGANAATALHTDADLKMGSLSVPKGDYTLFVDISDADNWVLIVSKQTGEWGLRYDGTQDLGRAKMTTKHTDQLAENLVYTIADAGGGKGSITLAWENISASVPVSAQ